MNRFRILSWIVILALLGALWFAADAALGVRQAGRLRDRAEDKIREAFLMGTRNRNVFLGTVRPSGDAPLKALVQEAGMKEGVQIAFLTETEKEAGKGRKEKQVSARLVRSPHSNLVLFLEAIESRGAGARVKELHLRPSKELSGIYEEVEILLSRVTCAPEVKP